MKFPYLLLIPALFVFTNVKGTVLGDTSTIKKFQGFNKLEYKFSDYNLYFEEGISYIRKDSLQKGIALLSDGVKLMNRSKKVSRIGNYYFLEFTSFLDIISNGDLIEEEKKIGQKFISAFFTELNPGFEKTIDDYLKKFPNSSFINRLKLYLLSITQNKAAEVKLDKLLKKDSLLIAANTLKAEILYDQNKYKESINYFSRVIRLSPEYAHAYNYQGKCYSELGRKEKAIDDFSQAILLFPDYEEALVNRGEAKGDLKQYESAISDYKKALKINPGRVWALYNVAESFKMLNSEDSSAHYIDSALHYIDQVLFIQPDYSYAYSMRGNIYYDLSQYDKSIKAYTEAIELEPSSSSDFENRGNAYYYSKKLEAALKDFEEVSKLDSENAYVVERIGDCYGKKEDYSKAISYYKKALKIDPERSSAYIEIGRVYTKLKEYKAAIEAFKNAIKIDSTYDSALGNLGWTYYCSGDFKKCITYSYKALQYDKEATYAMFNIPLATLRLGDYEKSKELYQYFIDHCKKMGYKIGEGAIDDLKDLLDKNILVEEANYILKNLFNRP